jgi:hypothetical protein
MRRMKCALLALVALSLVVLAACGGAENGPDEPAGDGEGSSGAASFNQPFTDASFYPVIASSEIVVGENRFLVGLLDDKDAPVANPKIDMHISFYDLGKSAETPVTETDMRFIWIQKPYQGIYVGEAEFEAAGKWGAEVTIAGDGADERLRAAFQVEKSATTPAIGDSAPSVDTPTAADVNGRLSKISTDPKPDPDFYELSVDEAIAAEQPFVVAFATPKFCASQTCGPTLQIVKQVADDFPKVNFLHVEPYELPAEATDLEPVRSVTKWGLPTEPWVFVVDERGRVAAKFEGAISVPELGRALSTL